LIFLLTVIIVQRRHRAASCEINDRWGTQSEQSFFSSGHELGGLAFLSRRRALSRKWTSLKYCRLQVIKGSAVIRGTYGEFCEQEVSAKTTGSRASPAITGLYVHRAYRQHYITSFFFGQV